MGHLGLPTSGSREYESVNVHQALYLVKKGYEGLISDF